MKAKRSAQLVFGGVLGSGGDADSLIFHQLRCETAAAGNLVISLARGFSLSKIVTSHSSASLRSGNSEKISSQLLLK